MVIPAQIVERHGLAVPVSDFTLKSERTLEGRQDLLPGMTIERESHSHPVQYDAQPTPILESLLKGRGLAEMTERPRGLAQRGLQEAEIAQRSSLGEPVAQRALDSERLLEGREGLAGLADDFGSVAEVAQAHRLFGPVMGPAKQGERLAI